MNDDESPMRQSTDMSANNNNNNKTNTSTMLDPFGTGGLNSTSFDQRQGSMAVDDVGTSFFMNSNVNTSVAVGEMERFRAAVEEQKAFKKENKDETLGGLLTAGGQDVRRMKRENVEDDKNDDGVADDIRRTGTWRGMALAPNAAIQWDFAVETLDYKVQAMDLSSKLVIYIFFIIAFCFFFLLSRNVDDSFFLQKVVFDPLFGSEIAKIKVARFFTDILSASMFVDYINDILLIQTVDLTYPTGGNYFLGAARFRTQRVMPTSCSVNNAVIPETMPSVYQHCYGELTSDSEDVGLADSPYNTNPLWTYKSCADMGYGVSTFGELQTYHCGGYFFELPYWRPLEEENREKYSTITPFPTASMNMERMPILSAMYQYIYPPMIESDPPFLDNVATRFAMAELFAYNPAIRAFVSIKLFSEVANGGYWVPLAQYRVFSIWTAEDVPKTVYDGFFYLFVFYYLFQFFADLVRFHRRERKILAYFFDMWNLLEMINLIIFIVVLAYRIIYIQKCVTMERTIDRLTFEQRYPVELDEIMDAYMMQVYCNSVNVILTFLKLLKFLRLNDRLNVLTRTLSASQDSIVGVLVIFFLVVSAYAMTGYGLFGLGVWAFRSVDASFSTLLQMLVGNIDYESLKNENRIEAGFFFWSYVILALFCLLNFLIGVLMEAFAEVSSSNVLLPLESVLAKTWSDWVRILNPKTIWHSFVQLIHGNTKEVMLQDAVEMVRAYRSVKFPPGILLAVDQQFMNLDDYEAAVDDELADRVGRSYMAYIWDDLVYEWDRSNEADDVIKAQKDVEMTTKGVRSAIGLHMKLLETFSGRMTELERNLGTLSSLLDAQRGGRSKGRSRK